jgi:hypothetical protein
MTVSLPLGVSAQAIIGQIRPAGVEKPFGIPILRPARFLNGSPKNMAEGTMETLRCVLKVYESFNTL